MFAKSSAALGTARAGLGLGSVLQGRARALLYCARVGLGGVRVGLGFARQLSALLGKARLRLAGTAQPGAAPAVPGAAPDLALHDAVPPFSRPPRRSLAPGRGTPSPVVRRGGGERRPVPCAEQQVRAAGPAMDGETEAGAGP